MSPYSARMADEMKAYRAWASGPCEDIIARGLLLIRNRVVVSRVCGDACGAKS